MAGTPQDLKLTPELYEVFRVYKRATTKVERWLAVATGRGGLSKKRLTIPEMKQAAEYVRSKLVKVPDEIYHAFKQAIHARSTVTNHFKLHLTATEETKAKDASHEHFTGILGTIFKTLCSSQRSSQKADNSTPTVPISSNRFAKLATVPTDNEIPVPCGVTECEEDDFNHMHEATHDAGECGQDDCGHSHEPAEDDGIVDDDLVQDFELYFMLWNLSTTCDKVKSYWASAAANEMPVMLATFLTNAVLANVARRSCRGRSFCNINDVLRPDEFVAFYNAASFDNDPLGISTADSGTMAFKWKLCAPTFAFNFAKMADLSSGGSQQTIIEKPQDYFAPLVKAVNWAARVDAEDDILNSLMKTIIGLPKVLQEDLDTLSMNFYPLMDPLDLQDRLQSAPTSAIFTLRLFLETYESWTVSSAGELRSSNARIHALKFGQEVLKTLERFQKSEPFEPGPDMHCECPWCPPLGRLTLFKADLIAFTQERRFDLYHQSPMAAGYSMTRILARATDLGTSFCNCVSQYVGVVLHLYNLLRQYDLIEQEDILLEPLCKAIGHIIFRGPRPSHNYYSQYAAFQGATLNFHEKENRGRLGLSNLSKQHLHYHSLSVMTGLNGCNFRPHCHRWKNVWDGVDKSKRPSIKGVHKTAEEMASHPLICVLDPLEQIVRPEWEGEFPIARLNWFEVCLGCTEVLERMATAYCEDPRNIAAKHIHTSRDDSFHCGKSRTEALLFGADRGKIEDFMIDQAAEIQVAKTAIRETFKGRKKSDFLWSL